MDDALLGSDICDLVSHDGLDISSLKSPSQKLPATVYGISDGLFANMYNDQSTKLESVWKVLEQTAKSHLQEVILKLTDEKDESLQLLQSNHNDIVLDLKSQIKILEDRLVEAEKNRSELQLRYFERGERLAAVSCCESTVGCKKVQLLCRYLSSWKLWHANEKRLQQLDKFAVNAHEKLMKFVHFSTMSKAYIKNKCERERDESVYQIDSTARNAIGALEVELQHWRTRALDAEKQAVAEQASRLKMEEDVKRLLLRNMTCMNIEALSVFHQHVFPEGEEEERSYFPTLAENATNRLLQFVASGSNITAVGPIGTPGTNGNMQESIAQDERTTTTTATTTGVNSVDTTLILTKYLQLQQEALKKDINYSPIRNVSENEQDNKDPPYSPTPRTSLPTSQQQIQSSSLTPVSYNRSIDMGEEQPRSRQPVPLAVNVCQGNGLPQPGPSRPWRGAGNTQPPSLNKKILQNKKL